MATIACYKDYTLHIDPPALPVPVCWWPFEVGVTFPWPDTAVPGLNLVRLAGFTGTVLAGSGKVGLQDCRIDTAKLALPPGPARCELSLAASTALLNMSLDGFTMTGWVGPNVATFGLADFFGIRFRAYAGIQVDPYPPAYMDVYITWAGTGGGTIEIGMTTSGVVQMFQLIPFPLVSAWHFFTFIYDRIAGKIRFSFNNAALTTGTDTYTLPLGWSTGAVVYETSKLQLGTSSVGFDEVNYFNSILDAGELSTLYNGGIGTTYP